MEPDSPAPAGRLRRPRGVWRVNVEAQAQRMADELDTLPPPADESRESFESRKRVVERHLERARDALEPAGPLRLIGDWYSGAAIEAASASLHRAGETLLTIQSPTSLASELPDLRAAFESSLPQDDPRRIELKPALDRASEMLLKQGRLDGVDDVLRAQLRAARRAANAVSCTAQASVRRWRNALVWAGAALALLALVVVVVNAIDSTFLALDPKGMKASAPVMEPWSVALVGALGGALAALLALTRFSGFTDPFGLPTAQALLRVPTAAATALFGVVLMQTQALDALEPQQGTTVLAFAFVFGYAQEPLLRMVDRQAGKVLNPARDKSEPAKPASPPPTSQAIA